MLYRILKSAGLSITPLVVVGLVFAVFAPSALATNGHQDHQGACSRSTESIPKMVGDLKFNGVLQDFANAMGVHGFNGSLTKQMEEKLVVGVAVHATAMSNHGCTGTGGVFGAGTRVIEKGEHVVVRVPPKFGKEACRHPSSKCKKVRIVVHTALPVSCGNKNGGRLEVWIWVRKTIHKPRKHHKHHRCGCKKPKPPKLVVNCAAQGLINGPNGTCVNQTVTVTPKQECEASDHSSTGCTQTTTTIVVNCGNYSSGNTGNLEQGDNCTQKQEENTCVDNSCNQTPPPKEECGCKEEPTIKITAMTELNMIPAGRDSGPFYVSTYASESGGTLTVDPGIGGFSSCESSTPSWEGAFTVEEVPSGASKQCVKIYAPEDADQPATMTIKVRACLGVICDTREQTVKITYPIRP